MIVTINQNTTKIQVTLIQNVTKYAVTIGQEKNEFKVSIFQNVTRIVTTIALLGEKGLNGDSAYAVAIENGFIGTESEWLLSLVPEKIDGGYFY
jgi:hypothetical protein